MNEQLSYEADGFELDTESVERGHCCCRRRRAGAVGETDQESASGLTVPPWLNPLFRLYRAGRLGWKAGRFIDKTSGQVFGKPISDVGADYLYKRLGRSRRLEDFFDRLPPRVKQWLNQF